MTIFYASLCCALLLSCGTQDLIGQLDSYDDPDDGDPMAEDTPVEDGEEPGPPCWDTDDDGYEDLACGGADCDDTDPTIHPAAVEDCSDGVDSDCDGTEHDMVMLIDPVQVSSGGQPWGKMLWTGSDFAFFLMEHDGTYMNLFLTRLTSTGAPAGTVTVGLVSEFCDVAWSGSEFALMSRTTGVPGASKVDFDRISPDGTRPDRAINVTDGGNSTCPRVAWTGSEYLVAWVQDDFDGTHSTRFTRLDPMGSRIIANVTLATYEDETKLCDEIWDVAWTGNALGIAYWVRHYLDPHDSTELHFASVSADGSVISPDVRLTHDAGMSERPALAWTGSEFGMLWYDGRASGSGWGQYFARLNLDGAYVDSPAYLGDDGSRQDMVWSGSRFLTAWPVNDDLVTEVSGLSPTGTAEADILAIPVLEHSVLAPQVVWTGSEIGIMWGDGLMFSRNLYFTRIGFCE